MTTLPAPPFFATHADHLPTGGDYLSAMDTAWRVKVGLAEMLKGGVIMDVTTP